MGHRGARTLEPDLLHRVLEQFAVLGHVDGFTRGRDEFDAVFGEYTLTHQVEGRVQRRLATHRGQQRVRFFLLDDARQRAPVDGLDVDRVGYLRVGHDGGRVRIHEDDAVALLPERLAGLGAGIVELAGLPDDDGAGPDDQDAFDVCAFWHCSSTASGGLVGRRLFAGAPGPELLLKPPQHEMDEAVEHAAHFLGPGAGFRVALEAEGRLVDPRDALQRAVEQRAVRGLE